MLKVNVQKARHVDIFMKVVHTRIKTQSIRQHYAIIFKEELALMDKDALTPTAKTSLDQRIRDDFKLIFYRDINSTLIKHKYFSINHQLTSFVSDPFFYLV
jgi:hypothetical protein